MRRDAAWIRPGTWVPGRILKWKEGRGTLAIAVLLALVAALPFLTRPGLPHQTDVELHVYRAAELGHALRSGAWYPRWAPDFYFGYGYPIFNYYAPFTYYLANLFDLLPGVGIVEGVKAVFVAGLCLAAIGTYLLGRELWGPLAGVVAAAAYTFAPYVVLIDPHARGVLAEHFAICVLPWVFYAWYTLMNGVGGRWGWALAGSTISMAVVLLSHNLLGLVTVGLVVGYWLWESLVGGNRARMGWGGLALVLMTLLTAFFWLPFLMERDAIRLDVIGPGHFDFHRHFLSWQELLAPSRPLDLGTVSPAYQFNLGLAQWVLALLSLIALWQRKGRYRTLGYFAAAALGLVFLMTSGSVFVWEHVPGMAYLQFPWRLMGPANLMLAVSGAGGVVALLETLSVRWRGGVWACVLLAILGLSLPVLYPPMWPPDFGPTGPGDIIAWERQSLALGTTSTGDFLPVKAALAPVPPMPSLIESYAGPGPVDKVNRASLPAGTRVDVLEHGPLHDRFQVTTSKKFIFRLYTFYFPGWTVYVDGEPVEIEVAGPEGFITFRVPPGRHEVLVRFEDTPPRKAGWLISAVGLVGFVVGVVAITFAGQAARRSALASVPPVGDESAWLWMAGGLLLFIAFKVGVADPQDDWFRYTSPVGEAWAAQYEHRANFGGQIELLGFDLPRGRVPAGEYVAVTLYWRALAPMGTNYQSFVHLARPLHILWGQEDHLNPGDLPTTRWPLDKYVRDEYRVWVLPGTPPGEYVLNVGLPSWTDGYRLQRYDEQGQAVGDSVVIATVQVTSPRRPFAVDELDMTETLMADLPVEGLTLLGYLLPVQTVTPPGSWSLTLFWRAGQDQPNAHIRTLVLENELGEVIWSQSGPPVNGDYPFAVWRAGEVVRDPCLVTLTEPSDYLPGRYRLRVRVDGGVWLALGEVQIQTQDE